MMTYRREIDGLRAVAVMPVLLFHAGFSAFSGGFVGVDVFFVISGYLITSIIIEELEKGSFSIGRFYERRARRILPALFLVLFACVPASYFLLAPSDLRDFSKSLLSVSLFSSNILFWLESGYFDTATELKPLIHTWSLAVEEQFYVFFPLLLMLLWKRGHPWILPVLVVASLSSRLISVLGSSGFPGLHRLLQPDVTLYLLNARALGVGVGVSCSDLSAPPPDNLGETGNIAVAQQPIERQYPLIHRRITSIREPSAGHFWGAYRSCAGVRVYEKTFSIDEI